MRTPFLITPLLLTLVATPATAQQPVRPASAVQAAAPAPIDAAIAIAKESARRAAALPGYSAKFYRRDVTPQGRVDSAMDVKVRNQPRSLYLKFDRPNAGREVLYVDGWNNNKIYAHEGSGALSFLGSISLDPNSARAKQGGRTIHEIGLAELAAQVIDQWVAERQLPGIQVQRYPDASLGELRCLALEVTHPRQIPGAKFHRTRFFMDKETGLPIAVQNFAFPRSASQNPPLVEDYRYLNLNTNVALTARDFDPRNPAYAF